MTSQTPDLDALRSGSLDQINAAQTSDSIEELRIRFLGKKGEITELLKSLGQMSPEERKTLGQEINRLKNDVAQALNTRKNDIALGEKAQKLAAERIDISLDGRRHNIGSIHPIRRTLRRMEAIFSGVGFDVATGPEIEDDWHNFEALNIAANHPARAMHDTFYVDDDTVLRTHTSPVQIRYMLNHEPPIQVVAPGRVYRCDSDITHTPMFHQLEGLVVGENVSFADLKGVLTYFLQQYFEQDVKVRFRPSYFPFTEPSAEADVSCVFCDGAGCRVCGHSGWIEVLGCGMVHPKVLENGAVDPEKFTGYAFGLGIERLTMMRYGINDLRMMFENDIPMLRQFPNS